MEWRFYPLEAEIREQLSVFWQLRCGDPRTNTGARLRAFNWIKEIEYVPASPNIFKSIWTSAFSSAVRRVEGLLSFPWNAHRSQLFFPHVSWGGHQLSGDVHQQPTNSLEAFDSCLQLWEVSIAFFEIVIRQPPVVRCQVQVIRIIVYNSKVFNNFGPAQKQICSWEKTTTNLIRLTKANILEWNCSQHQYLPQHEPSHQGDQAR